MGNNGSLDLLVTERDGFPDVLYRNHGNSNHRISLNLVGTVSNRSAIGAKVRVQVTISGKTYWQLRELGTGNIAQNDLHTLARFPERFGGREAGAVPRVRAQGRARHWTC